MIISKNVVYVVHTKSERNFGFLRTKKIWCTRTNVSALKNFDQANAETLVSGYYSFIRTVENMKYILTNPQIVSGWVRPGAPDNLSSNSCMPVWPVSGHIPMPQTTSHQTAVCLCDPCLGTFRCPRQPLIKQLYTCVTRVWVHSDAPDNLSSNSCMPVWPVSGYAPMPQTTSHQTAVCLCDPCLVYAPVPQTTSHQTAACLCDPCLGDIPMPQTTSHQTAACLCDPCLVYAPVPQTTSHQTAACLCDPCLDDIPMPQTTARQTAVCLCDPCLGTLRCPRQPLVKQLYACMTRVWWRSDAPDNLSSNSCMPVWPVSGDAPMPQTTSHQTAVCLCDPCLVTPRCPRQPLIKQLYACVTRVWVHSDAPDNLSSNSCMPVWPVSGEAAVPLTTSHQTAVCLCDPCLGTFRCPKQPLIKQLYTCVTRVWVHSDAPDNLSSNSCMPVWPVSGEAAVPLTTSHQTAVCLCDPCLGTFRCPKQPLIKQLYTCVTRVWVHSDAPDNLSSISCMPVWPVSGDTPMPQTTSHQTAVCLCDPCLVTPRCPRQPLIKQLYACVTRVWVHSDAPDNLSSNSCMPVWPVSGYIPMPQTTSHQTAVCLCDPCLGTFRCPRQPLIKQLYACVTRVWVHSDAPDNLSSNSCMPVWPVSGYIPKPQTTSRQTAVCLCDPCLGTFRCLRQPLVKQLYACVTRVWWRPGAPDNLSSNSCMPVWPVSGDAPVPQTTSHQTAVCLCDPCLVTLRCPRQPLIKQLYACVTRVWWRPGAPDNLSSNSCLPVWPVSGYIPMPQTTSRQTAACLCDPCLGTLRCPRQPLIKKLYACVDRVAKHTDCTIESFKYFWTLLLLN